MAGTGRDWEAEIDRWTERFRAVEDPPEPFAGAIREGWDPTARRRLVEEAEAYAVGHASWLRQISGAGVDLVRLDAKQGDCGVCRRYVGHGYSLRGESPGVPPPPPLPICPACRHTLNLLTPFFMQSLGIEPEDLVDRAVPYEPFPG